MGVDLLALNPKLTSYNPVAIPGMILGQFDSNFHLDQDLGCL